MGRLFGTDGVRGIANETLDCSLAMKIGCAAAIILGKSRNNPLFVVGYDTRISSKMLFSAVAAGLCSGGSDVLDIGVLPTPAVAYLAYSYGACAGIMISASHNSFEYNGIKIFGGDGFKIPDETEDEIEAMVFGIKDGVDNTIKAKYARNTSTYMQSNRFEPASYSEIGNIKTEPFAVRDYIEHLKSTADGSLEGLKIVIDCANGSASYTAREVFSGLGAECELIFCDPNGKNINLGCGSTNPSALCKYVKQYGFDAGAAFDGDADRCFCADSEGNLIDGDTIMAICALDMKRRGTLSENAVVGTALTNLGFRKFCAENGIAFFDAKVGDRFVLEKMLATGCNLGGEQSGHLIFRDFATTGDGQLTAVQIFSLVSRKRINLSGLASCITKFPQTMINIRVSEESKDALYTNDKIKNAVSDTEVKLGSAGRIVVRVSGTEPLIRVMVEHESVITASETTEYIAGIIRHEMSGI